MSTTPSLMVWLESLGLLALGSGALIGLASLFGRAARAALWRRIVWRAVMMCLAILLVIEATGAANWLTAELAILPSRHPDEMPSDFPLSRLGGEGLGVRGRDVAFDDPLPTEPEGADSIPERLTESGVWWPGLLWLAGTLTLAVRGLLGRSLLIVFRSRNPRSQDAALNERVRSVSARLGFTSSVWVMETPRLCGPVAFGILRPTLAVPADFTTHFDGPRQEVMLAHELAHLAARDPAWMLLSDLVTALLWWQPLVWWSRRQLRSVSELVADEASLLVAEGPGLLAACLVELGTRLTVPQRAGWVRMAGTGFRSSLGRRVERLLHMRNQTWRPPGALRSRLALVVAVAALLCFAVLATAWVRSQAFQEGDEPMQTVQRSWRRSLVGVFLLAALPPANDASPAEDPAKPPPPTAATEPRNPAQVVRDKNAINEQIQKLNAEYADLRDRFKKAAVPQTKSTLDDLEVLQQKIAALEVQKHKLEAERKELNSRQIRVFRLKHVMPEEVRQALHAIFGLPVGYEQGTPMPGSYVGPPGGVPYTMPAPARAPGSIAPARQPGTSSPDDVHDWRLTIDERTQSIVMRGSRHDLRLAADLIALLDVPDGKPIQKGDGKLIPKGKILQVFKLKYARADKLAEILDQLGTEARFLSLKQTNRLIVGGPESVVKEIADLIEQLDVEGKGEGATPPPGTSQDPFHPAKP